MISQSYKADELKKPFVVAYIVPNMNDPEMKKVVAAQYANSMSMMFGGDKQVKQISNTTVIDNDDPEELQQELQVVDAELMTDEDLPPWGQEELEVNEDKENNVITCEGCAEIIEATGGKFTAKDIQDYSKRTFAGKTFCRTCQTKAKAQRNQK